MSLCNFPTFSFSFLPPLPSIDLPPIPDLSFTIAFPFPACPLD